MQLIPAIRIALGLVGLAIVLAEDAMGAGTGAEKKAAAIAHVQAQLPGLVASAGLPGFVAQLLGSEAVLSVVIDLLVSAANAGGHLQGGALAAALPNPSPEG